MTPLAVASAFRICWSCVAFGASQDGQLHLLGRYAPCAQRREVRRGFERILLAVAARYGALCRPCVTAMTEEGFRGAVPPFLG